MTTYELYFDGASKRNPGPAGAGAVLYEITSDGPREIWSKAHFVGNKATNNMAEYTGLIIGLQELNNREIKQCAVYGDSNLVIQQMRGEFKVSAPNLLQLYINARELAKTIPDITFTHVYRDKNKRADALSNEGVNLGP